MLETGAEVTDLEPGDRVMGLIAEALRPVAVTDRRMVVKVPSGWTFVQAAAVPVVYLTAYYGLIDLAGLEAGESVLVHARPAAWAWPRCSSPGTSAPRSTPPPAGQVGGGAASCGVEEEQIASSRHRVPGGVPAGQAAGSTWS